MIALIAHDGALKDEMVHFVNKHRHIFKNFKLIGTGHTAELIAKECDLDVKKLHPGKSGGDVQVGSRICENEVEAVFFFRDPMTSQPHAPDVNALLRLCDVHNIPIATNPKTGEALIEWLDPRRLYRD